MSEDEQRKRLLAEAIRSSIQIQPGYASRIDLRPWFMRPMLVAYLVAGFALTSMTGVVCITQPPGPPAVRVHMISRAEQRRILKLNSWWPKHRLVDSESEPSREVWTNGTRKIYVSETRSLEGLLLDLDPDEHPKE